MTGRQERAMYRRWKETPTPDRWVVEGVDQYGNEFIHPGLGSPQTQDEANFTAAKINGRGGSVKIYREKWNGPAVAYRRS